MSWTDGWTDDPVRDAERYSNYLDEEMKSRPICVTCGEYIVEDFAYETDSGDYECESCNEKRLSWF